jgi:dihydropteroate synthase
MRNPNGRGNPLVMGILNVTPDSFSDGGRWTDADEGASIIDVGAESTRPGCTPVSADEEWARLEPVLRELIPSVSVPVSVDTMKSEVASKCISLGAAMINDVNGFRGEGMFEACAGSDVDIVISHMNGSYDGMHSREMGPDYRDRIREFLDGQISKALDSGIPDRRIIIDPGIGFGKTPQQNLEIAKDCSFLGDSHRILIGLSRKRFVREFYPEMDVDDASAMLSRAAVDSGADIVRVHDVARTVSALRL